MRVQNASRVNCGVQTSEAFGLRLSFWRFYFVVVSPVCASLELVFRPVLDPFTSAQSKAAERTAAVQDAIASYCAWKSAKLLECACPSGAFISLLYHRVCASLELVFRPVLDPLTQLHRTRQNGQPQSKTLSRVIAWKSAKLLECACPSGALVRCCITGLRQSQTRVSTGT